MATVRFKLRNPAASTPQPVYLVFRYQNARLVHGTGVKVAPRFWNAEKGQVKNTSNVPDRDAINALLSDLEAETNRFYSEALARREFTLAGLKSHLEKIQGRGKGEPVPRSFFDFFRQFIEASKTRIQPDTGERLHPRTIAKYETTLRLLETFAGQYPRRLDFDTLDLEFYEDFADYLQGRVHRKGSFYSANAIGKHVQVLKTILNEATAKGVDTNPAFKSRKFRVLKEESDNVYLSEPELEALYRLDLSGLPRLERVRDLFIVGTWTGLRFSDLTALNPSDHIRGEFIEIEQYKTGGKVWIPLHPYVREVLEKYGGRLPAAISNQKFNEYLKEACRAAGLVERVPKAITRGGQRVTTFSEKWRMVSTHTARRSFATNLYKSGFPSLSIMQITGHKTERAFLKYVKVTGQEHARLLKLHWEQRQESPLKIAR
ncbi:MAG: site-specific integrase [Saprospiraceae bacterium]